MNADDALKWIEELLLEQGKYLNDLQRVVFVGSWQGKSYKEIYRPIADRYQLDYIMRDVGPQLWHDLSALLGEKISKKNLQGPITRIWHQRQITNHDSANAAHEETFTQPSDSFAGSKPTISELEQLSAFSSHVPCLSYWVNVPDVSLFLGRSRELEQLEQWITIEGCRLIALYGVGGLGKTALSIRLAHRVSEQFEFLVWLPLTNWRSLNRPPTLAELLKELISFLSHQQDDGNDLFQLLFYLSHHRCLVVLDGVERILPGREASAQALSLYEDYSEFFKQIGTTVHQSCVVLTTRELPKEVAVLDGEKHSIRTHRLRGLEASEVKAMFQAKGSFSGADSHWRALVRRYAGNPYALNVAATAIRDVCEGDVARFLEQIGTEEAILEEIQPLLDQQLQALTQRERGVVSCLAKIGEPISFEAIAVQLSEAIAWSELQEVLRSLRRKGLIEVNAACYSLDLLFSEYVANLM